VFAHLRLGEGLGLRREARRRLSGLICQPVISDTQYWQPRLHLKGSWGTEAPANVDAPPGYLGEPCSAPLVSFQIWRVGVRRERVCGLSDSSIRKLALPYSPSRWAGF
jgi:hypothetical protein